MATSHSIIGASGMYRWKNCAGSVRLCRDLPHRTNEYAEEGTHAHEIGEDILRNPERIHYHEMVEDEEMMSAVRVYVDLILHYDAPGRTRLQIEQPFDMSKSLYPGLFGTSDTVAYYRAERLLRVYDYKHGKGKRVEVEENDQLLYYALGALLTLPSDCPVDFVEVVIVQPRISYKGQVVHRWRFPMLEKILDFAADLVEAAKRTEDPNASLVVGNWCFFCPAVGFCPAQHAMRAEKAKTQFSVITPEEVENLNTEVETMKKENDHGLQICNDTTLSGELPECLSS